MSSNYTDHHDLDDLAAIRQDIIVSERQGIRRHNEFKKECKNTFVSIKLKVDEEELKRLRRKGMSMLLFITFIYLLYNFPNINIYFDIII